MSTAPQQQNTPATPGAMARVRLLGEKEGANTLDARVAGRDGKILTLMTAQVVSAGTPVRIDVDGGMVLGEVMAASVGQNECTLSVKIDQIVPSVSELAKLVEHVMWESQPSRRRSGEPEASPVLSAWPAGGAMAPGRHRQD